MGDGGVAHSMCAAKKEEEVFNFARVDWEERERSGKDEKV
jgi:hypothetical protein